jgi:regulatory protein
MSEPRVARLDLPALDGGPADVLDLGEVGHVPPATDGAAVASLGEVPGVRSAASVADLDTVGPGGQADLSGSSAGPAGRGAATRDADRAAADGPDLDGPERGGSERGRGRDDSGPDGRQAPADLDAIRAAVPASARLARLDGPRPRRARREPGPADAPAAGAADPQDDPRRCDRRGGAEEPVEERATRPPRTRRPPGPKQIDPDADPVAAARDICLRLLTDRARTRTELAQALARRGVPADAADAVLERFDEVGLIDDAAFAGQWVRSRHRHRGLARRAIAQELRRKGVDDEVAGEALAEVDGESEARRARELVDRKLRTVPAGTPEQRTAAARKLVGMLARKGYGAGVAYGVVKEALAEHGADHDELGGEEPVPD